MKKYLLLLALFVCLKSNAQVPGYLGKRFSVGYALGFSPAGEGNINLLLLEPFAYNGINYQGKDNPFYALQLKHTIEMEYVLGKRFAVTGGYQFYRFAIESDSYDDGKQNDSFYRSKNTAFKVGFVFSKNNYIAPQGKYVALDFQLINSNNFKYAWDYERPFNKESYLGINVDFGRKRIYYDRLIVDFAFGIGFSLPLGYENIEPDPYDERTYMGLSEQISFNLFHFKTGVRYLLF